MATWPGTLPTTPLTGDYSEHVPPNVIRTQMDVGPPKVRRRSTAGVRIITMNWSLTKAQVATLDTFYVTTTVSGATSFDGLAHPRTGAATTFRFVGPPIYTCQSANRYKAETQMEILP